MASQAQLDLQLAELIAQQTALEIQYAAADDDNDGILLKSLQYEIKQVNAQIAQVEAELAAITQVPAVTEVVITTDRPEPIKFPVIDPNFIDANEPAGNTASIQDQKQAEADARQDNEAYQRALEQYVESEPPTSGGSFQGLQGKTNVTRSIQTIQDAENANTQGDWRVRLSLAPSASYLYKAANPGILKYLQATNGVVFPYVPNIQITYAAHYETADIVHSNYKLVQYKNSAVDQITITCDFTAQDTYEANYLLAVIHFFRSVTKMFYGRDEIPKPGTPPPLCYLTGLGAFQFDNHPLVITTFNYNLPTDVDYIRAGSPTLLSGVDSSAYNGSIGAESTPSSIRRGSLNPGATQNAPQFTKETNTQPTYVPTKMQITVSAYPIVTRNDISNNFSLQKYATGSLLQGSKNSGGGGIW